MRTKIIAFTLSLLTTLMIAGCTQEAPLRETEPSQVSETLATEEASPQICRGKLVVNGRDITGNHDITIYQPNGNAHIPLLTVAEALGAETHWRDAKVAVIEVDGEAYEIDTAEEWFGILIPPGAENAIREVADSEMIIDIYSLRGLLKNLLHAEISIDYSEAVIYIDSETSGYTVQTEKLSSENENHTVEYPRLVGDDYTTVNDLIVKDVERWLAQTVDAEANVDLGYRITYSDDTDLSILFEGEISAAQAAHPIRVAHGLCISLTETAVVDPLRDLKVDQAFVGALKKELPEWKDENYFTQEQWQAVSEYICELSDEQLQALVEEGEIVWLEAGILICISVPHAIGDYLIMRASL